MYFVDAMGDRRHGPFVDRREAERFMVELAKRRDTIMPLHLKSEVDTEETAVVPMMPERQLMIEAAEHIARMDRNHSEVNVPTLTGDDTRDRAKVGAFLANVAKQAEGVEAVAHDGACFKDRRDAAKAIMQVWAEISE